MQGAACAYLLFQFKRKSPPATLPSMLIVHGLLSRPTWMRMRPFACPMLPRFVPNEVWLQSHYCIHFVPTSTSKVHLPLLLAAAADFRAHHIALRNGRRVYQELQGHDGEQFGPYKSRISYTFWEFPSVDS
jgi:hypothetical protein